jgi:hypothetical protein
LGKGAGKWEWGMGMTSDFFLEGATTTTNIEQYISYFPDCREDEKKRGT